MRNSQDNFSVVE